MKTQSEPAPTLLKEVSEPAPTLFKKRNRSHRQHLIKDSGPDARLRRAVAASIISARGRDPLAESRAGAAARVGACVVLAAVALAVFGFAVWVATESGAILIP